MHHSAERLMAARWVGMVRAAVVTARSAGGQWLTSPAGKGALRFCWDSRESRSLYVAVGDVSKGDYVTA